MPDCRLPAEVATRFARLPQDCELRARPKNDPPWPPTHPGVDALAEVGKGVRRIRQGNLTPHTR